MRTQKTPIILKSDIRDMMTTEVKFATVFTLPRVMDAEIFHCGSEVEEYSSVLVR